MGCARDERSELQAWLKEDFGGDGARLLELCVTPESGRPMYLTHVDIALRISAASLTHAERTDLEAAYVYVTAAYYCTDATYDGKATGDGGVGSGGLPSDPGRLIVAATRRLAKLARPSNPELVPALLEVLSRRLAECAHALEEEKVFKSDALRGTNLANEFFHLWGRSSSFVFLIETAFLLATRSAPADLLDTIKQALAFFQLGDDVGDWRTDFETGNWTFFLRQCCAELGRVPDASELRDHVYLSGALERELRRVECGLKECAATLRADSEYVPLAEAMLFEANKAWTVRDDLMKVKQLALS